MLGMMTQIEFMSNRSFPDFIDISPTKMNVNGDKLTYPLAEGGIWRQVVAPHRKRDNTTYNISALISIWRHVELAQLNNCISFSYGKRSYL